MYCRCSSNEVMETRHYRSWSYRRCTTCGQVRWTDCHVQVDGSAPARPEQGDLAFNGRQL